MGPYDPNGSHKISGIGKRRKRYSSRKFTRKLSANINSILLPSRLPQVAVDFGCECIPGLIDTGSARSFVSSEVFSKLKAHDLICRWQPTEARCVTATSTPIQLEGAATLKLKIGYFSWKFTFLVSANLSVSCIIGADFIKKTGLIPDLQEQNLYFAFHRRVKIPFIGQDKSVGSNVVCQPEGNSRPTHLSAEQQKRLDNLCDLFPDVLTKRLGLTHLIEYDIKLKENASVKAHPYKLSPPKMAIMREHINELLNKGIIEPSVSAYSSAAFLVPKGKSGDEPSSQEYRCVIDYRKLNQCIEIEQVPLPDLHSAFHWFGKAKFFSVIDLNQAYHQIPLSERSRDLTAFCVPWMLYRFTRVPFGLATGAQVLTRLLDQVFEDVKFKFVFNFLDDCVVYSETFDEHLEHLREVFTRLRTAGLTVNPKKLRLAVPEISFLGHLVSERGVSIDPSRTTSIRKYEQPNNAKSVARFIGMVNFYSKFIHNFAEVAAPLNRLRKKGVPFVWGADEEIAFRLLKEALMNPPVLKMVDFSQELILTTDSSGTAIGSVLQQEVEGGRRPIAYYSRVLTAAERKFSIYELEGLAVVESIEKFRSYLEHAPFLLETDNQALSWLLRHPKQIGRIGRWIMRINSLKFRVQHIRSNMNVVADALSRMYESVEVSEQVPELKDEQFCNITLTNFPLAFSDITQLQKDDPEIQEVKRRIEQGTGPLYYLQHNGTLYYQPRGAKDRKLVLPKVLVPMVFDYFHSSVIGGHLGNQKTTQKVGEIFYWTRWRDDIRERVRSCKVCGLSKPAQETHWGKLASDTADHVYEKLYCDFVGPYVRSREGYTYLFTVIDAFSKFVWIFPIRKATAEVATQVLQEKLFQHFSVPRCIVSDNGPQFTSRHFQNFCFSRGIRHITTSPYRPHGNQVERFHRNLKSALIAYHGEDHTRWSENLSWIQLAFNTAHHTAVGATPFKLMFGHRPNHPLANVWNIDDLLPDNPTPQLLRENWLAAKKNLLAAHERVRTKYNRVYKTNPFQSGDLVWCKNFPFSRAVDKIAAKLSRRWTGPFRINHFLTPVTVQLQEPETGRICRKAHISHLKAYHGD